MTELKFDFNFTKYINSKFKHIVYQDDIHAYYNLELDTKLISVTQALKKFEPVFNKEYWLKTKAKQRSISVQDCDIEVIWFHEDDYKIFQIPYLKDEVEIILNKLRNENS